MPMRSFGSAAALLVLACASDGPTAPTGPPAPSGVFRLERVGEPVDQVALAGRPLPDPLRVIVTRGGVPAAGIDVTWVAEQGTIAGSGKTDAAGIAEASWTLPLASTNSIVAHAKLPGGSTAIVSFVATARFPALEPVAGSGQSGMVESELPVPLQVRATWQGEPVEGYTIVWSQPERGVSRTATTGADGTAATPWQHGTAAGNQLVRAEFQGGRDSPRTWFNLKTLPGPLASLAFVWPAPADAIVLPGHDLMVQLAALDQFGNLVADAEVELTMRSGGQALAPAITGSTIDGSMQVKLRPPPDVPPDFDLEAATPGAPPVSRTIHRVDFHFEANEWDWVSLYPSEISVPAGSVVRWGARLPGHAVRPAESTQGGAALAGTPLMFAHRFDVPGTFIWECSTHAGEQTTIIVTP